MRIIFVRHGESEANVANVFSNRGWKHPLTPRGREQSELLCARLAGRGVVAIYTSPIQRAVETAQILTTRLTVPHTADRALIEYDVGIYEGRDDDEGWQLQAAIEKRWDNGEFNARMPGGESCNDIRARFLPFIDRIINQYGSQAVALICVSHGGALRRALPMFLANVEPAFAVSHGLANTAAVEAELREGALRCVRWGDHPMD